MGVLCTAHGALPSCSSEEPTVFLDYKYLYLAYKKVGMPNCRTKKAFEQKYLFEYIGTYRISEKDFWQIYLRHLEAKFDKGNTVLTRWENEKVRKLKEERLIQSQSLDDAEDVIYYSGSRHRESSSCKSDDDAASEEEVDEEEEEEEEGSEDDEDSEEERERERYEREADKFSLIQAMEAIQEEWDQARDLEDDSTLVDESSNIIYVKEYDSDISIEDPIDLLEGDGGDIGKLQSSEEESGVDQSDEGQTSDEDTSDQQPHEEDLADDEAKQQPQVGGKRRSARIAEQVAKRARVD